VPVLTSERLWSRNLALGSLLLIELGLAGMVCGFWLLGTQWALLLPAGGGAVILGILAGCLSLAIPLARKRPRPLSARFVIAGLVLLLLTGIGA
jgi:glucose dehydrogenase